MGNSEDGADKEDKENKDTDNSKKQETEKETEKETATEEVHSVHVMNTPAINKFKNLDLKETEQTALSLNDAKPPTDVKDPAPAAEEEEEEQIVRKKKSKRKFVSDSESD